MGTMSITAANAANAQLSVSGADKHVIVIVTGSTSYATGGDTMPDCSTSGNLGQALGFTQVHAIEFVGQATAANDLYYGTYVPSGTFPAFSATAGLVKFRDLSAAADAEVAATTNLSTVTWVARITGR